MNELKEFFEKYKPEIKKYTKKGLIISLIPIVVIHLLFKWNTGIDFFAAEWGAGDVLGYIGTILTFAGTIVLSILALQASQRANALSQKVIELEQDHYRLELRPFVLVSDWYACELTPQQIIDDPTEKYISIGGPIDGNSVGLAIELMNTTESCVSVEYKDGQARTPSKCWGNSAVNQGNLKMTLKPGDTDTFIFYGSSTFINSIIGDRITIELVLENRFAQRYKESFVIILTSLSNKVYQTPGKMYCHLFAQEYKIGRFEKKEDGTSEYVEEKL